MRRIYKNVAEETFCKWIEKQGFSPIKRGWPDFICFNDKDEVALLVEVKDTARHPLKKEQHKVMLMLSSYGIPCYRWDLETQQLEKVTLSRRPRRQPSHSLANGKA